MTSEVALRQPAISPTPRQSEPRADAPHRFSVFRQLLTAKPEKSPAIIARAGLEPVRDRWTRPRFPGRRRSPIRRLFGGGLMNVGMKGKAGANAPAMSLYIDGSLV